MDFHPTGHPAGPLACTTETGTNGALDTVTRWLRCPHCRDAPLHRGGRALTCPHAHNFDIARRGYVSLLPGRRPHHGDGPAMVAARERFLGQDHYRPLRSTITALTAQHTPARAELVVDLAGTGHYLAPVLDALPTAHGAVIDLSTPSLRRATRAHPRAVALAADLRGELPLASRSAGVALSVFGPRPAGEIARVLATDGVLVLATARDEHLRELQAHVGALGIDPRKRERLLSRPSPASTSSTSSLSTGAWP